MICGVAAFVSDSTVSTLEECVVDDGPAGVEAAAGIKTVAGVKAAAGVTVVDAGVEGVLDLGVVAYRNYFIRNR